MLVPKYFFVELPFIIYLQPRQNGECMVNNDGCPLNMTEYKGTVGVGKGNIKDQCWLSDNKSIKQEGNPQNTNERIVHKTQYTVEK